MVGLTTEGKIVLTIAAIAFVALIFMAPQIVSWFRSHFAAKTGDKPLSTRGADQAAPSGVQKYLEDLQTAAPQAPAEFILRQAKSGATLAECQRDWIKELLAQQTKEGAA